MADFYIKQGASQPILTMKVNRDNVFSYEKFNTALENSAISFSMSNVDTGILKIAKNRAGFIANVINIDNLPPETEYIIYYQFTTKDTNKPGRYKAEFKIDFIDSDSSQMSGTFIGPVHDELYINVLPSLFVTNKNSLMNTVSNGLFTDVFGAEFG